MPLHGDSSAAWESFWILIHGRRVQLQVVWEQLHKTVFRWNNVPLLPAHQSQFSACLFVFHCDAVSNVSTGLAHYAVRCCVARRRAYVQSENVLRLFETETGRVRERQRGDQVQLSTTVPPTVLRLHRQPGAVLRLPRSLRQRLLPDESDGRCNKTRLLQSWGRPLCRFAAVQTKDVHDC